jgi:hypothetical protein
MAVAAEPDEPWVVLRRSFTNDYLEHTGTGERKALVGRFVLYFDGGNGRLVPESDTAVACWAGRVLQKTFHKTPDGLLFFLLRGRDEVARFCG